MPHDVMSMESSLPEPEFDDLPASSGSDSPLLAAMKQAGRALVTRAKRNLSKNLVLAAMIAASAAICRPAHACAPGCTCINGYPAYCGDSVNPTVQGPWNTMGGDPVNVDTGNLFYHVIDYSTAGPNPLQFIRYYNSIQSSNLTGGFENVFAQTLGMNWRSNYDNWLQIYPATSPTNVVAERADGQQILFTLSGSSWVTNSNLDYTLTQSGSTWTLTGPDATVESYGDGGEGVAQLNTITYRDGYQQTLHYGSGITYPIEVVPVIFNWEADLEPTYATFNASYLTSVTDSYGRSLSFTYNDQHLIETVSTPDSLVLTIGYTSSTSGGYNLTSMSYNTDPATSQTYSYTATTGPDYGNEPLPYSLTSITDENGNTVASWTYDEANRATSSFGGAGSLDANSTSFTYNGGGSTTVTNAFGVADTYSFTELSTGPALSGISRASTGTTAAASESFGYDSNGFLDDFIDWNGNETQTTNDSHGQPTSITEGYGSGVARTTTIAYDSTWVHEPDTITTPGDTITFTYDGSGNVATRTDTDTTSGSTPYSTNGQTREWQWTWNGTGELLTAQLPRTDATVKYTLTWSSGALATITDPVGNETRITSSTGGGYPETIVDPNGVTTTLGWDTRLNLNTVTVETGAGNRTTNYTHDAANNLTAVQWPDGSTLDYAYDTAHRLTTVTDLPGNTINLTLDYLGDVTALAVKNPSGTTTLSRSATFDALGRPLTTVGGASQTTSYSWDPNSNLLSVTDPLSNTVSFTYDALNRLATRTDPSPGGTTTFTLDAHNRLTAVQDANGNTTSYTRDGFGNVTQVTSPDTGASVYTWDKDRNLTQMVFNGGQTVNLTYDAADRNLTVAYPSDSSLNISKTYDQSGHGFGKGRLTSVTDQAGSLGLTYDERGNITNESRIITSVGTLTTATAFDANSNISSITYPSGTVVAYTRDSMGRVTGITAQPAGAGSPSNVATSITHAPFGPVTGLTFGNGVTGTYSFDNDYRATSRVAAATSDVMNLAYTYFANNSVNTITDSVNAANSQTLGYDALDRLTSAVSGTGGYGTYGWTWDAVGNVATQTINSTATTFNLNSGSNQLASMVTGSTTTTVDTTANGNIADFKIAGTAITSYTYNQANQMASATGSLGASASYEYGFQGQRLLKTPSSGYPIAYQYGQAAKELLSENDLHSGQTADYIYMDPGRNNRPVGEVDPTSGSIYFMHTGRLGTVQAVTDSSKSVVWSATYNPFGDTNAFSGTLTTQSLRLPGQYFDPETGNNHNGFRDYAGTLTRYVQSDPLGLGGGMNTYQYARGNPFKWTDRLGLDPTQNQNQNQSGNGNGPQSGHGDAYPSTGSGSSPLCKPSPNGGCSSDGPSLSGPILYQSMGQDAFNMATGFSLGLITQNPSAPTPFNPTVLLGIYQATTGISSMQTNIQNINSNTPTTPQRYYTITDVPPPPPEPKQ